MKKLLLIDGNSLFYRAYHAMPSITDKSGEVANAVFGFSNMLLKAINEVEPDYIACTFDTRAPTFRHVNFEKYKAQRKAPPPDLYPQLPKVKKVLDAFGIKYFEKEGYEADDLIATLAEQALHKKTKDKRLKQKKEKALVVSLSSLTVIILSGDRDVLQLVDGNIKAQMPSFAQGASEGKPGWGILMGAKEVKKKFGITPEQMVDYKSLMGDSSDNIPGIAGIGPKTASTLLIKYKTLENLFEHLDEIEGSTRDKLEAGKEDALTAKKLVELDRNVELKVKIADLSFNPNWNNVRAEYEVLGFKSIVAKIPGKEKVEDVEEVAKKDDQLSLV